MNLKLQSNFTPRYFVELFLSMTSPQMLITGTGLRARWLFRKNHAMFVLVGLLTGPAELHQVSISSGIQRERSTDREEKKKKDEKVDKN